MLASVIIMGENLKTVSVIILFTLIYKNYSNGGKRKKIFDEDYEESWIISFNYVWDYWCDRGLIWFTF